MTFLSGLGEVKFPQNEYPTCNFLAAMAFSHVNKKDALHIGKFRASNISCVLSGIPGVAEFVCLFSQLTTSASNNTLHIWKFWTLEYHTYKDALPI